MTPRSRSRRRRPVTNALILGALGVVFGDIGTSPLYSMQIVFSIDGGVVRPTRGDVLGVISLVFWSITLIVSVKYVALVMRADNDGEGGVMALAALVQRAAGNPVVRSGMLVTLGVFGAALFYGDSVITPAISVLSAVEGLDVSAPALSHLVVPIALAVIALLFVIQRWGTAAVGRLFGPVMVLWFAVIAVAGLGQIVPHAGVVAGLLPSHAVSFVGAHPGVAFAAMGAVMLAITGAEALYADMGHFGAAPIRRAWFALVFPALTLNYLGQAAVIMHRRGAVSNPFFLLVPHGVRFPMVVLATLATVIASQAVISGAYSVARQSVRLGFFPRMHVRQTSEREIGQIYVPVVNWTLLALVAAVVLGFRSSQRLGAAYGVAVSGTFVITTILFLTVARLRWRWPPWAVGLTGAVLLAVEGVFLAANLTKIHHGGWLPLVVAAGVFTAMTTWHRGREIVTANRTREEGDLGAFIEELRAMRPPLPRVPGTAVFPSPSKETTPLALRANVEHNHVLHERVVIVTVKSVNVPHVRRGDRVAIDDLGYDDDNITHVTATFGFQDDPDIPDALRLARARGLECDIDTEEPSYFVSLVGIHVTRSPGMRHWRKRLFVALARNAASPVEYFGLPPERTISMSAQIPL